ncbi:hypothetical protein B5E84_11355 [Lachnoclostridium sp. An14]|uniref:WD40 repeat domain-containing serine/threonine protein kinase n=1 Tax=Lachnoclostridium sp. An14 TaxID=1965562 RepID=UPI000B370932|nr:WD40 repeat domain-containing serine/threonine protein kinase [Lachnoclostridium sp. An14]OUQ16809.1 hypothetical protein B5E84_11355 [Lachnoclostridium sp. An14]
MGQIIAGVYEIDEQIGSGGGGVVYLGRHLRLKKQIVLKADKRTLATGPEALRREVDMLKGLSFSYIPQVYDFVEQNGVVYTVMEYIEGESLDKVLARGEQPPQAQVIQWAGQLLEALVYLHGRPPHGILHGDIKPANIMVRPSGDICLIDYNIALALRENGAVRVGGSRGYASPEHYGLEFGTGSHLSSSMTTETIAGTELVDDTEIMDDTREMDQTATMASPRPDSGFQSGGSTGGRRTVMLDVRSDIYSLGATLYHLLSGSRPAQDAGSVEPLGSEVCSPLVAAIIKKAMAPDPGKRYQTAEDMLAAFRSLSRKDKRTIRRRRRMVVCVLFLSALFLSGGFCTFVGLKQMEQRQAALALAGYSADALAKGDVSAAVELALQAIPKTDSIWNAPVTAQAQKALTDALGVYDLSDGFKTVGTISLPSAPFSMEMSPEGTYLTAVCSEGVLIYSGTDGSLICTLPARDSALSECVFAEENRIVYAGDRGVTAYDLDKREALWTGETATTLAVSGDGTKVAAVNRDEDRAVVYRISDGEQVAERSFDGRHLSVAENDIFANPQDSIFELNEDGSLLAVSFSDGGLVIFDLEDENGDMIMYDDSSYDHFAGGFCGPYFAFAATKSDQSLFGLIDTVQALYMAGSESRSPYLLHADKRGIDLANGNLLVRFDRDTLEELELAYTENENITAFSAGGEYVLVSTDDNGFSFFDSGARKMSHEIGEKPWDFLCLAGTSAAAANRSDPQIRLMALESHEETEIWSYDARYGHDEARISADGQTAMLFDYQSFKIYSQDGTVVAHGEFPNKEQIYDQQFRKSQEGSWLEVIWYDGTVRRYSAADGSLLGETKGEPPSADLYEEFLSGRYRVESSLHRAPEVYDTETGKQVAVLQSEDYLTYVTQAGDRLITEYVTADGFRYGLLLNEKFEPVAYLPGFCDIQDEMAVFDYGDGNLRQCRLYSLQELIALGESNKK